VAAIKRLFRDVELLFVMSTMTSEDEIACFTDEAALLNNVRTF
jgi:hypothetical protein